VSFVVSLNLHRRHLSESQRAMVAARIANLAHGQRADLVDTAIAVSQEQAAEQLNVSVDSVQRARRVREQGVPELATMVESGAVAVSTAAVIAEVEPEEQREVIAAADEKEIVKRANEIKRRKKELRLAEKAIAHAARVEAATAVTSTVVDAPPTAEPVEVVAGQWWQLGKHLLYCGDSANNEFATRAEGAAFAFADPPYNAGKADWDHNFQWRHDYLTDVAEIVAVTPGISAIADFFAVTRMPYRWSMAAWITNGMTRGALGFGNWIYLALFSGSASLYRNTQDHLRVNVDPSTTGDTAHESRKPARLLVDLIELFTANGDVVVDPFLGSGTTLFAAEQAGRRCVGAEMNPKHSAEIIARFGPEAKLL
jgi:DNA-binding transcriptional regulator YdaS (Cro superfamily)